MPSDRDRELDQRRCPVCWTWFTPNPPNSPYPRRYCCGACRIEDSRRRRTRQQTQSLLDAEPDTTPALNRTDDQRRETVQARRLLDEWSRPTNPD